MSAIQKYATLVPYMVGIGNHEQDHESGGDKDPSGAPGNGYHPKWGNYGKDSGGECGVPMFYRFHMPDNGNSIWWYVIYIYIYIQGRSQWGSGGLLPPPPPIAHESAKIFS